MLLIDLYDGKDVYEGLEACKINPTYSSNQGIRNDLEYYIPQFTYFPPWLHVILIPPPLEIQ